MKNAKRLSLFAAASFAAAQNIPLAPLPYDYGALEPYIDEMTLRVHHLGHHAAYTHQLNNALEAMRWNPKYKKSVKLGIDEMLHRPDELPPEFREAIRDAGGGFVNHALQWQVFSPFGGERPTAESDTIQERKLAEAIDSVFGSFEDFQHVFSSAATGIFGSGWAWLYYDRATNQLAVTETAGNDTPAMDANKTPIFTLDVWEHAYYLKYQNRRAEYIAASWELVDWPRVATLYAHAAGFAPEPLRTPEATEKRRVGLTAPFSDADLAVSASA